MNCDYENKTIWYLGASKYYIDEKIVKIPYREWYKQKKHLKYAEELRNNIEIERDMRNRLDFEITALPIW